MKLIKMKKFLFVLLMFISSLVVGQTNSSGDGEWRDVVQNSYRVSGGSVVNILHNVYSNSQVNIWAGGTLNIVAPGELTINAGLVTFIGGVLTIDEGATLIITGDLSNIWNGDITINGTLEVTGDVDNLGSNVVIGDNGNVDVDGTFTNSGTSTIENNGTITATTIVNDGTIDNTGGEIIADDIVNDGIIDNTGGVIDSDVTGDGTIYGESPLPIELIEFNGYYDYNRSVINWATASEINNDYFVLEHSADGVLWETTDYIQGTGNSSTRIDYNYNHYTRNSYYYRLTQVDYDGMSETFNIIHINTPHINEDVEYDVYDMMGKFIVRKRYNELKEYVEPHQIYLLVNGLDVKKVKF